MRKLKLTPGPHMIFTEARDLDEALEILRRRQMKTGERSDHQTLKSLLHQNKMRQALTTVTLSDRVVKSYLVARREPAKPKKVRPSWTKAMVQERFSYFRTHELARLARVPKETIIEWIAEAKRCG